MSKLARKYYISLFFLFIVFYFESKILFVASLDYNENCTISADETEEHCNATKKLRCSSYSSECICQDQRHYDIVKQTCVRAIGNDYTWLSVYSDTALGKCVNEDDCPFNAKCVPFKLASSLHGYKYCKCKQNTFQRGRKCVEAKQFGQNCVETEECHLSYYALACINNSCQCNNFGSNQTGIIYYDKENKKCYTYPGERCAFSVYSSSSTYLECLEGSTCLPSDYGLYCQCNSYDQLSPNNKTCLVGYNRPCNENRPCNNFKGLICVNGICVCESEKYHVYVTEGGSEGQCFGIHGAPCDPELKNDTVPCKRGMECIENRCTCEKGTTPEEDNQACFKNFHEACHNYENRIDYTPCNSYKNLTCINGRCLCVGLDHVERTIEFYNYDILEDACDFEDPLPSLTRKEDWDHMKNKMTEELRPDCLNSFSNKRISLYTLTYLCSLLILTIE